MIKDQIAFKTLGKIFEGVDIDNIFGKEAVARSSRGTHVLAGDPLRRSHILSARSLQRLGCCRPRCSRLHNQC